MLYIFICAAFAISFAEYNSQVYCTPLVIEHLIGSHRLYRQYNLILTWLLFLYYSLIIIFLIEYIWTFFSQLCPWIFNINIQFNALFQ